ncbi:MAG: NADH-quinone oxidoreductase subunit L [Actinomycetota bacterium]
MVALGEAATHAAAGSPGLLGYAWLVALLPFVSAVLALLFGRRTPGKGPVYGIAAIGAGLIMSLGILWHFVTGGGPYASSVGWFTVGPLHMELGQYVDGLTAVMLVVVTSVSLCVHIYSLGYMDGDVRFTWFYVVLSLFTGAMLNVVVADNLFQLLVGWEIMGVCSYLLIGHWYEDRDNSNAAIKAFITTRVGDVPFMFGIFALVVATGVVSGGPLDSNIQHIAEVVGDPKVSALMVGTAALLLFGGTIGKSAQFPLYVWLPDAMAGPTPVSALIHAATMVAAGVYLVARMFEVFIHADPIVLSVVSVIGAITLLLAAFLALIQNDIKKVLAYSTISQLAYMVAALGLGEAGYSAGMFHLFTHAFFKGLLFLGAGSVIHAVHTNDMREMGGLRSSMPTTFWTYLVGSLALAGVVGFSGFFSKDELIVAAYHDQTYWLVAVMLVGAALTAFYTGRMVFLTFFGEYRGEGHPHESPVTMTGPLIFLAAATLSVGWLGSSFTGAPFFDWVYLGHPEEVTFVAWIAGLSTLIALGSIFVAYVLYGQRARERDPILSLPGHSLLEHKYYLDDLYLKGIVRPIRDRVSAGVNWVNQNVLDGVVNGMAALARGLSTVVMLFDRKVIDGAVNGVGNTARETGGLLRYLQSGNVQRYAVFLFAGVMALAIVFTRIA